MKTTTVEIRRGLSVGFKVRGQLYVKVNLSERYPGRRGVLPGSAGRGSSGAPAADLEGLALQRLRAPCDQR